MNCINACGSVYTELYTYKYVRTYVCMYIYICIHISTDSMVPASKNNSLPASKSYASAPFRRQPAVVKNHSLSFVIPNSRQILNPNSARCDHAIICTQQARVQVLVMYGSYLPFIRMETQDLKTLSLGPPA